MASAIPENTNGTYPVSERFAAADLGALPTVSKRTMRRRKNNLKRLWAEEMARAAAAGEVADEPSPQAAWQVHSASWPT